MNKITTILLGLNNRHANEDYGYYWYLTSIYLWHRLDMDFLPMITPGKFYKFRYKLALHFTYTLWNVVLHKLYKVYACNTKCSCGCILLRVM